MRQKIEITQTNLFFRLADSEASHLDPPANGLAVISLDRLVSGLLILKYAYIWLIILLGFKIPGWQVSLRFHAILRDVNVM